ncbi:MAG: hypothetical protein A2X32_08690 [Elusimicrobia bacterium GWC2_64_44]|nr:MAG: hypothetical protein A2X32_08690 [Elusimicrobia bacterium GWC2_64_44]
MKKTILFSAVAALLAAAAVIPAAASDCAGFLPHNDLKIPVDSPMARGISEAQFNEVMDTVEKIYKPIVAARGGVLVLKRLWTDATVNASAQQSGKSYILNMYGGLARHETITQDGMALVACHELGHHLGGAPKTGGWNAWASNEGQSDYFANLKCLRLVFADKASKTFTALSEGDEVAGQGCEAMYSSDEDRAVCYRAAMAGKSVAYLFKALRNETVTPRYDTPSATVVTTMMSVHPPTQCRMDTYLAGSLCTQPVGAVLSETNPAVGTCTRSAGFTAGFRPLCWYKPANAAELLPPGARTLDFDFDGVTPEIGPAFSVLRSAAPLAH